MNAAERRVEALRLYDAGLDARAIGKRLGCTAERVRQIVIKFRGEYRDPR